MRSIAIFTAASLSLLFARPVVSFHGQDLVIVLGNVLQQPAEFMALQAVSDEGYSPSQDDWQLLFQGNTDEASPSLPVGYQMVQQWALVQDSPPPLNLLYFQMRNVNVANFAVAEKSRWGISESRRAVYHARALLLASTEEAPAMTLVEPTPMIAAAPTAPAITLIEQAPVIDAAPTVQIAQIVKDSSRRQGIVVFQAGSDIPMLMVDTSQYSELPWQRSSRETRSSKPTKYRVVKVSGDEYLLGRERSYSYDPRTRSVRLDNRSMPRLTESIELSLPVSRTRNYRKRDIWGHNAVVDRDESEERTRPLYQLNPESIPRRRTLFTTMEEGAYQVVASN